MGSRSETASGHLFGVAHQFVEMDLGSRNERADASAAFDDALLFQSSQRVAGGHQTDLMNLGEVSFRRNRVTRAQLSGFDALSNGALNSLVRRHAVAMFLLFRHWSPVAVL